MDFDTTTLIVIGSIFFSTLIVDGILLGIIFITRRKVAQASNWPSTMGTVTFSTVEVRRSSEGSSYYPVVHYTYQVMGQPHQGNKIMPGPAVGGSGAHKVVERYPAGAQVMVYYDPDNPSDAVLERGMPGHIKWLWVALILTDLFLCGLSVFLAYTL
ncbi:MAG TPA: DUF3592 domain-containing protein [Anaerolineales bacterium]|nr:DUF3592 domain-containing protein [Anaerolineales bacterium]